MTDSETKLHCNSIHAGVGSNIGIVFLPFLSSFFALCGFPNWKKVGVCRIEKLTISKRVCDHVYFISNVVLKKLVWNLVFFYG